MIKKAKSIKGQEVKLTMIKHVVFGECYYIFVDGELSHFQYGTRSLDPIFNEFITCKFDLVYG